MGVFLSSSQQKKTGKDLSSNRKNKVGLKKTERSLEERTGEQLIICFCMLCGWSENPTILVELLRVFVFSKR